MKTLFNQNTLYATGLLISTAAWADDCDLEHEITKVGQTHWLTEKPIQPAPAPPFLGNSCEFRLLLIGDDQAITEPLHHAYYNEFHHIDGDHFSYRFSLKLPTMLEYMEDNNELMIFQLKSHKEFQTAGKRPVVSLSLTNHPAPNASTEPLKQWRLKIIWGHGTHGSTNELILREALSQQTNIIFNWQKLGYNDARATLIVGGEHYQRHVPSRIKSITTQLGYIRANKLLDMGNQIEFGVVHASTH